MTNKYHLLLLNTKKKKVYEIGDPFPCVNRTTLRVLLPLLRLCLGKALSFSVLFSTPEYIYNNDSTVN
jgi:hypothetical protein